MSFILTLLLHLMVLISLCFLCFIVTESVLLFHLLGIKAQFKGLKFGHDPTDNIL